MAILTVTPNPALDMTVSMDRLENGRVNRASSSKIIAGGKGVNVSACLADWGMPGVASGFLGRSNVRPFEEVFAKKGILDEFLRLDGDTRTNIKLVATDKTTEINLPGLVVGRDDPQRLWERIEAMPKPELAVLSGSLPPGCPVWLYRDLLERFGTLGVPVILDANSHALANAVESTRPPLYVKPNREELAEWAVRDLDGADDLIDAAREILCRGVRMAVVSLGPGGALFVTRDEAVWAWGAPEKIAGTVGAGDAMVAGLAAAWIEKADLERTARLATAFSLAKMTLFGANLPDRAVVEDLAARVSLESGSGIEAAIRRAEKTV